DGRGVGRSHLEAEVAGGEVLEDVVRFARLDEVRGDGGVDRRRGNVHADGTEAAQQLLAAVRLQWAASLSEERLQGGGYAVLVEEGPFHPDGGVVASGERHAGELGSPLRAGPGGSDRHRPRALLERGERLGGGGGVTGNGDVDFENAGSCWCRGSDGQR